MPVDSIDGHPLPTDYSKKKAPVRKRAATNDPSDPIKNRSGGASASLGPDTLDLSPAALEVMRQQRQQQSED